MIRAECGAPQALLFTPIQYRRLTPLLPTLLLRFAPSVAPSEQRQVLIYLTRTLSFPLNPIQSPYIYQSSHYVYKKEHEADKTRYFGGNTKKYINSGNLVLS